MLRVAEIMQQDVAKIDAGATLAEAARTLRKWQVSAVMVVDEDRPVGILTERDLVQVVVDGENPAWFRVSSRMSTSLVTVTPDTDSRQAMDLMAEHGIRHLPVVDGDELVGLVSLHDHLTRQLDEPLLIPPQQPDPSPVPVPAAANDPLSMALEAAVAFRGPYYDGPPASALVVVTIIGVLVGGVLSEYIPTVWLQRIVASAFIVIGVLMLAGKF